MIDNWGEELHVEIVDKLAELLDDDTGEVETPSGLPWCGCLDCVVREVLTLGWDRFRLVAAVDS